MYAAPHLFPSLETHQHFIPMESSQRSTRSSPLHFAGNLRLLKLEISLGHLYRLPRIEISRLIAGHRLGSAHQDAFYIVRAQIGVGLQHQGDHAGADGCCHRCAGQADIMLTRFSGSSLSKSEPGTDKEMMSVPGA